MVYSNYFSFKSLASSVLDSISSFISFVAFLNSFKPLPKPFANSGNFLPPKRIKTRAKIRIISGAPKLIFSPYLKYLKKYHEINIPKILNTDILIFKPKVKFIKDKSI